MNMELKDVIPIIIAIVSLIVSIINGVIVYQQTYKINKYEFMSKEKTKEDILDLLSALNMIIEKSTCAHLFKVDFEKEKQIISNFLLSDTWMITRYIIGNKDEYILVFASFLCIAYSDGDIGELAIKLKKDIEEIYFKHFNEVIKEKSRFKKDMGKYSKGSSFSNEWYDLRRQKREKSNEESIKV